MTVGQCKSKFTHADRKQTVNYCATSRPVSTIIAPVSAYHRGSYAETYSRYNTLCYSGSRGSVSRRMPLRMSRTRLAESVPILSPNWDLSTVKICEILTTLCRGRLASPGSRRTLPGAVARRRLEVSAHTTTVWIRLRLKTLFWTTTCGWRYPGSEPEGSSNSTQKMSPC